MNRLLRLTPHLTCAVMAVFLGTTSIAHSEPLAPVDNVDAPPQQTREHHVHTRVETSESPQNEDAEKQFVLEINYANKRVEPAPAPTGPQVSVSEDGLNVESADGRFKLGLSPFMQFAYRLNYSDSVSDSGSPHGFLLEKFRPSIRGRYADIIEYQFTLDIKINSVAILDALVTLHAHPRLRVRLGLQKPIFGLEQRQSTRNLLFFSRSLASNIGASRDLGLAIDARPHDRLRLELGVYNGTDDRTVFRSISPRSVTMNAGANVAILGGNRATEEAPWYLNVGGAVSLRRVEGDATNVHLTDLNSTGGRRLYNHALGVFAHGRKFASTAYLYGGHKGLYVAIEHMTSNQQTQHEDASGRLVERAWSAAISYAFGGMNGWSGVVPNQSVFDGGLGALRLAFRVHEHSVRSRGGRWVVPTNASPRHDVSTFGFSAGAGWQLSKRMRIQADYDNTQLNSEFSFTPSVREHVLRIGVTAGY